LIAEITSQPIPEDLQDDILELVGEEPNIPRLKDMYRLSCASGKHRQLFTWLEWSAYGHLGDTQNAVLQIPHECDFSGDWKETPEIIEYHDITGHYPKRECAGMVVHTMKARPHVDYRSRHENWKEHPDYDPYNDIGWLYEVNPNYMRYAGMPE